MMMSPIARCGVGGFLLTFPQQTLRSGVGAVDSRRASSFGLQPPQCQPWHGDARRLPRANFQVETHRSGWNTAVIVAIQ
jgi:hypothetical protein